MKNLILLICFLSISTFSFSQADYTSVADGDWETTTPWGGTSPGAIVDNQVIHITAGTTVNIINGLGVYLGNGSELHIWGIVNVTGGLILDASDIHVYSGGEFNVIPGVDLDFGWFGDPPEFSALNGSSIVNEGSTVLDLGDVLNFDTSTITNTGFMSIEDDIDNYATITNSGTMNVGGDVDNNASGTFNNSGTVNVGGSVSPAGSIGGDVNENLGKSVALPIELISFNAYQNYEQVEIIWTTASEINNDYFTIQRSTDGVSYEDIATIMGAGNSNTPIDYSYTDYYPVSGISYYRLMQTDYNGDFEIFNPVAVSYFNSADIAIGPIPATEYINVSLSNFNNNEQILIFNIVGKVVKVVNVFSSTTQIPISDLPAGTYIVKLKTVSQFNQRIIKQ